MKLSETKISVAGVFRCCVATVHELSLDTEVQDGQLLPCKWCKDGMILRGSTWKGKYIDEKESK